MSHARHESVLVTWTGASDALSRCHGWVLTLSTGDFKGCFGCTVAARDDVNNASSSPWAMWDTRQLVNPFLDSYYGSLFLAGTPVQVTFRVRFPRCHYLSPSPARTVTVSAQHHITLLFNGLCVYAKSRSAIFGCFEPCDLVPVAPLSSLASPSRPFRLGAPPHHRVTPAEGRLATPGHQQHPHSTSESRLTL